MTTFNDLLRLVALLAVLGSSQGRSLVDWERNTEDTLVEQAQHLWNRNTEQAGQVVSDQVSVLKSMGNLVVDVVAQKTDFGLNVLAQGKDVLAAAATAAGEKLSNLYHTVAGTTGVVVANLAEKTGVVAASLAETTGAVVNGIAEKTGAVATGLAETTGAVVTGLAEKTGAVATGLAETTGAVVNGIAEKTGAVATGLAETTGAVAASLAETKANIVGNVRESTAALAAGIADSKAALAAGLQKAP